MAAHETADPHGGNDQDRAGRGLGKRAHAGLRRYPERRTLSSPEWALQARRSSQNRAPRIVSGLRRDRPAGRYCAGVRTGAKEGAVFRKHHAAGRGPMLLVTGGAGFIGSNVVANLNDRGRTDIAISDRLETGSKWRNLPERQLADLVAPPHPGNVPRRRTLHPLL